MKSSLLLRGGILQRGSEKLPNQLGRLNRATPMHTDLQRFRAQSLLQLVNPSLVRLSRGRRIAAQNLGHPPTTYRTRTMPNAVDIARRS
jgi:hypothetical protein